MDVQDRALKALATASLRFWLLTDIAAKFSYRVWEWASVRRAERRWM